MSQKPVVMEQLKQILQLKSYGIAVVKSLNPLSNRSFISN